MISAARVSFATIGSPASSVVTDSKFKRPCTSTSYTLLGRLGQSHKCTFANFHTPAWAVYNSHYTVPASESHLHTFCGMCHLRSADLQLEGLIKSSCGIGSASVPAGCKHCNRLDLVARCTSCITFLATRFWQPASMFKITYPLRKHQHPLPHCHRRKHMLHQVRIRLHHSPCVAAHTHPAPLPRIRCQKVLAAGVGTLRRAALRNYGRRSLPVFPRRCLLSSPI